MHTISVENYVSNINHHPHRNVYLNNIHQKQFDKLSIHLL